MAERNKYFVCKLWICDLFPKLLMYGGGFQTCQDDTKYMMNLVCGISSWTSMIAQIVYCICRVNDTTATEVLINTKLALKGYHEDITSTYY